MIEYQISQVCEYQMVKYESGRSSRSKMINDLNPKNPNFLVILSQSVRADQIFGGFNIQTI